VNNKDEKYIFLEQRKYLLPDFVWLKKGGADNSVPRVGRKGLGICSSESIVNLGKSAILYL
jgi:hypothetical protein